MIENDTRQQIVNGMLQTSLIDHLYSKQPDLIKSTRVDQITNSDHLGIWARKTTKLPQQIQKQIVKRTFKNLDIEEYLTDLNSMGISG